MIFPAEIPFVWFNEMSTFNLPVVSGTLDGWSKFLTFCRDKLDNRNSSFRDNRNDIGDMGQPHCSCKLSEQSSFVAFSHLVRGNDKVDIASDQLDSEYPPDSWLTQ